MGLRVWLKPDKLLTPVAFLAITGAVVIMTAERSGWEFTRTINFLTFFATVVAIRAIFALGLNVQWGYSGVFNFGVSAFFLVGAYTAAIFTVLPSTGGFETYVGGFGDKLDFIPLLDSEEWLPFLIAVAMAAIVSGVLAFLVSVPALRLREDYLAIATIGVAEVLRRVAIEERGLVNGTRGVSRIPGPLQGLVDSGDYRYLFFGIVVVVLILTYIAVERGIRSPWGRVLRALREDEEATAASGKNVFAFKSQAFVLGAVIMGIGGSFFAFDQRAVTTDTFTHFFGTFLIWAMLIVGGSGNNKGAILGAYVVWGFWTITSLLQSYELPDALSVRIAFLRDFGIGALIVLVLLLRPQGLMPEERRVSVWVDRHVRRRAPAEEAGAAPVVQPNRPAD